MSNAVLTSVVPFINALLFDSGSCNTIISVPWKCPLLYFRLFEPRGFHLRIRVMSLMTQWWPRAKHCGSVDATQPQGQTAAPIPVLFCSKGINSSCSPFTSGGQDFWLLTEWLRKPLSFSVDYSKRHCQGTVILQILLCICCASRPLFLIWQNYICCSDFFFLYGLLHYTNMSQMFWAFNLHSVKNLNF